MSKRELEFTTRLTREDVAGLIEALIEGMKDGHLKVQKSSEVLELEVPRVVDLKIEAEIDEERAEFEIEVSWLTNRAGDPDTVPEESPATEAPAAPPASGAKKSGADKSPASKAKATSAASGRKSGAAGTARKSTAKSARSGKTARTPAKKPE